MGLIVRRNFVAPSADFDRTPRFKRSPLLGEVKVRDGSSTEMAAPAFDVGFTLNIRHSFGSLARHFGPVTEVGTSFDHLVGAPETSAGS